MLLLLLGLRVDCHLPRASRVFYRLTRNGRRKATYRTDGEWEIPPRSGILIKKEVIT